MTEKLSFSFHRWGNWGPGMVSNLLEVTLLGGGVGVWIKFVWFLKPVYFIVVTLASYANSDCCLPLSTYWDFVDAGSEEPRDKIALSHQRRAEPGHQTGLFGSKFSGLNHFAQCPQFFLFMASLGILLLSKLTEMTLSNRFQADLLPSRIHWKDKQYPWEKKQGMQRLCPMPWEQRTHAHSLGVSVLLFQSSHFTLAWSNFYFVST